MIPKNFGDWLGVVNDACLKEFGASVEEVAEGSGYLSDEDDVFAEAGKFEVWYDDGVDAEDAAYSFVMAMGA